MASRSEALDPALRVRSVCGRWHGRSCGARRPRQCDGECNSLRCRGFHVVDVFLAGWPTRSAFSQAHRQLTPPPGPDELRSSWLRGFGEWRGRYGAPKAEVGALGHSRLPWQVRRPFPHVVQARARRRVGRWQAHALCPQAASGHSTPFRAGQSGPRGCWRRPAAQEPALK